MTERWAQIQQERGYGFPPIHDPTSMAAPLCSGLRIRKEPNSRDFMNSRMWDSFRATPATQVSSDMLMTKNEPLFMDMMPTASRTSNKQYRHQPEYIPSTPSFPTSGQGTLPPSTNSTNPYLQRLDAAGSDSRNIVRELRSAVTEDNRERDIEASKRLTERQFTDRWLPPQAGGDLGSLIAYELLRPKQYSDSD